MDNVLNIFNTELEINFKCRPSHDGMVVNLCFDPVGRYVLSLGCDGYGLLF